MRDELLERWLGELLAAPGLTAIDDLDRAWQLLVEDALRAVPLLHANDGPIVDVGSGGGSPGLPLAVALPERQLVLLESRRRKCDFLRRYGAVLPNVEVVWDRAELRPTDVYGVAVAKALAKPPTAAELCLPLVRPGGAVVLWVGKNADAVRVAAVAQHIGGVLEDEVDGLLVLRKVEPTPPGFPRRPGLANKRPLA